MKRLEIKAVEYPRWLKQLSTILVWRININDALNADTIRFIQATINETP